MRSKLLGILLIILIVMAGSCQSEKDTSQVRSSEHNRLTSPKSSVDVKELTIRNVTKKTVRYTIASSGSFGKPVTKSIKPGSIDRYRRDSEMDITFQQGNTQIKYSLDPGMPYSFRYNEDNQLELYDGSHGRHDVVDLAPYVATPMSVVEKMLEMAEINSSDIIYDLGCGDGRIVITAAKKYGAYGVGIDLDPQRIEESIANAKKAQVENLVEFRLQDVTKADFSDATIVTLYLLTESNELLRPLLEKQLKPGTYVVSHNYDISRWEDKELDYASLRTEDDRVHNIYVYKR